MFCVSIWFRAANSEKLNNFLTLEMVRMHLIVMAGKETHDEEYCY